MNKKLEVGEKYLSITILGQLKLVAFKNKDKVDKNQPDYKGEGIAIWINEKKAEVVSSRTGKSVSNIFSRDVE
jgi:hypothetical protein